MLHHLQKNPIWVYCAQNANLPTSHCGMGMVFGANPGFLFDGFRARALAIGAKLKAEGLASSIRASATAGIKSVNIAAPSALPMTHTIIVGDANGDTIYTPPFLDANVGDKLIFEFQQKNHSAVQSTFDNPCTSNGGFNSGL